MGPSSPAAAPRARRGCRRLSVQSCASPARGISRPKSAAMAPLLPAVSKPDFSTMPAYNSGARCLPAGGLTANSHSTEQRSGRRAARGSSERRVLTRCRSGAGLCPSSRCLHQPPGAGAARRGLQACCQGHVHMQLQQNRCHGSGLRLGCT